VRPYCASQHHWQVYLDTHKVIAATLGAAALPVVTHPVKVYPVKLAPALMEQAQAAIKLLAKSLALRLRGYLVLTRSSQSLIAPAQRRRGSLSDLRALCRQALA
jgi:hypothetical protein